MSIAKKKRTAKILGMLERKYGGSGIILEYKNPFELLVSVILSAQCTDKRVNIVTPKLFKRYRRIEDYANADIRELENCIKSTGFYRNKAKNIQNAAKMVLADFGGKLPRTMEEMLKIPGAGRKTANIVLSNAFGINEGIAVDTHVKRLCFRLGLTKSTNPEKIERDLAGIIPRKDWNRITYQLIEHGRAICKAPTPFCSKCFLAGNCPKIGVLKPK